MAIDLAPPTPPILEICKKNGLLDKHPAARVNLTMCSNYGAEP